MMLTKEQDSLRDFGKLGIYLRALDKHAVYCADRATFADDWLNKVEWKIKAARTRKRIANIEKEIRAEMRRAEKEGRTLGKNDVEASSMLWW